jgi:hypothetical protein
VGRAYQNQGKTQKRKMVNQEKERGRLRSKKNKRE